MKQLPVITRIWHVEAHVYEKKHDQTICSSLKKVCNSVPCPSTLFLSPGNIYHTTWLGWAAYVFWKYKLCHQSFMVWQQTCNYTTQQALAVHQGRHSPTQHNQVANLYWSQTKTWAIKQPTLWRTKLGLARTYSPEWSEPCLSSLHLQARWEGSTCTLS